MEIFGRSGKARKNVHSGQIYLPGLPVYEVKCLYNVWFKKTWTNCSTVSLLWCPGFLNQTLYSIGQEWKREGCHSHQHRGHLTITWTRRGRGGGGISQKSMLVHPGSLECPCGPKPSYFRKYFILLCSVMVGKKEIKLH